jgi:predicted nucleotidyltransferase
MGESTDIDRDQASLRIAEEAKRIAATEPGVRVILLAGSYAQGTSWPGSDVDLLVITEAGNYRKEVSDVDWTTFDTTYSTLAGIQQQMAESFIVSNAYRDLTTLYGDPAIAERVTALARQSCAQHIPDSEAISTYHTLLHSIAHDLNMARTAHEKERQAALGGDMVWVAGQILLARLAVGPVREDTWHDVFRSRAAELPFDAAASYAQWFLGGDLEGRLKAAFILAEGTLGQGERLDQAPAASELREAAQSPPTIEARPVPDAAKAIEMHRLITATGFGKLRKAEWLGDLVRQASEAGVVVWFAVPALLALGGAAMSDQVYWHAALQQTDLPFEAAGLYTRWLTAESFLERKEAAIDVGRRTMGLLEDIFRGTPYEHKYTRLSTP